MSQRQKTVLTQHQKELLSQFNERLKLKQSGYAGILSNGNLVDRREHPEARPIFENKMFGFAKPKRLENNGSN